MPRISVVAEKELQFDEGTDLRAASSLVRFGRGWLIAQDDTGFAAYWTQRGIEPVKLFDGEGSTDAHGDKPDLECGAVLPIGGKKQAAVFFGSGSRPSRMRAAIITRQRNKRGRIELASNVVEIPSLYTSAMVALGMIADSLDLSGACQVGEWVRFFQRGGGSARRDNASFDVPCARLVEALLGGAELRPSDLVNVRRHQLGALDGVPLGISAATALPDGRVLFAAVAEDSPNTYDDGVTTAAALGVIGPGHDVVTLARVPTDEHPPRRIQGLSCERIDGDRATLLALCDPDLPHAPAWATWLDLALGSTG